MQDNLSTNKDGCRTICCCFTISSESGINTTVTSVRKHGQLEGLTQVEEMLIARAHPIMSVYRKKGGQRGYSGHVVNLPQNIQGFLNKLPSHVSDLPLLVIRQVGANDTHRDWTVRRDRVLGALQWLKSNNQLRSSTDITTKWNTSRLAHT